MKKLLIFIGCLLVYGYVYILPAYRLSKDFAISRALGWSDPRFANFHRLFVAIEPGMTRAEVELTIDAHYPEHGKRLRPTHWDDTPQHLGLFMNPEHLREPNCEGISIRFADGKVVGIGYSMD